MLALKEREPALAGAASERHTNNHVGENNHDAESQKPKSARSPSPNVIPSEAELKARLNEVAARYRAQSRSEGNAKPHHFDSRGLVVSDAKKLFCHRHGTSYPEPSGEAEADVWFFARVMKPRWYLTWVRNHASWFCDVADAPAEAKGVGPASAADIAQHFQMTWDTKHALKIHMLQPYNVTAEKLAELKRQAHREANRKCRDRKRRRARAKNRADYIAESAQSLKPWKALGMSRAKWYRVGKPEPKK